MMFQLLKGVAPQRLVHARIDETPDRAGEIFDYASSKPHFEAWSKTQAAASGGKSLGNVRAMHQLAAAGVVQHIAYDDAGRAIEIVARVVDDDAWAKVETGVYTGISPGGHKRTGIGGDPRRYEAFPAEISLVDVPCIPSATFTLVKADGATEAVPLRGRSAVESFTADLLAMQAPGELRRIVAAMSAALVKAVFNDPSMAALAAAAGLAKADYSDDDRTAMAEKGEAEPDGSYPIKTKADLENAIHAYGRSKDKAKTQAHIVKRAQALDATDLLPADWDGSTKKDLKKGLADVAQMSALLESLTWVAQSMAVDSQVEGDASPLPGRMAAALTTLSGILVDLAGEESREACGALAAAVAAIPAYAGAAGDQADLEAAARIGNLAKAGARNSKADQDRVQAIHDHARDLGADCAGKDAGDDMEKSLAPLAKAALDLAALRKALGDTAAERDLLKARVAAFEALPAVPGPVLRAIGRDGDGPAAAAAAVPQAIAAMPDGNAKTLALFHHAIANPTPPTPPARRF